jgi:hypothetical protein
MSISASISVSAGSIPIVENTRIPIAIDEPVLSGDFLIGTMVTCSDGTWTNDPYKFKYQWYRDSEPIRFALSSMYRLVSFDNDTKISCLVTAFNDFGYGSQYSNRVYITG